MNKFIFHHSTEAKLHVQDAVVENLINQRIREIRQDSIVMRGFMHSRDQYLNSIMSNFWLTRKTHESKQQFLDLATKAMQDIEKDLDILSGEELGLDYDISNDEQVEILEDLRLDSIKKIKKEAGFRKPEKTDESYDKEEKLRGIEIIKEKAFELRYQTTLAVAELSMTRDPKTRNYDYGQAYSRLNRAIWDEKFYLEELEVNADWVKDRLSNLQVLNEFTSYFCPPD